MIKAEDLRLNNLIEYTPFTGIPEITEVNIYNLADICGESEIANYGWKDRYNPIELNEEWLIKIELPWRYQLHYDEDVKAYVLYRETVTGSRVWLCEVKYLHHLQNLIHSLTGTELTTKP